MPYMNTQPGNPVLFGTGSLPALKTAALLVQDLDSW
jgi:hypothetical protein